MKKMCFNCKNISDDNKYCKKEHWDLNCLVKPIDNKVINCEDWELEGSEK